MADIVISPSRTAALKDYVIQLSKAFCPRDVDARIDTTKPGDENEGLGKIINGKVQQPPQPAFKRLHLLYLLHDILMHVHAHGGRYSHSRADHESILGQLRPLATTLARLAVCGCSTKAATAQDAVLDVVTIWKSRGLFPAVECDDIKGLVQGASELGWDEMLNTLANEETKLKGKGIIEEDFDWTLPYRHSNIDDPSAPWHELPAANGLFMKRTRGFPLRAVAFPNGGYDIEGGGYRADDELKQEVTNLFEGMVRCHEKYTDPNDVQEIDALGNVVWKDAERPTRNYWGWVVDGIEARKDLAAHFANEARGYEDLPPVRSAGVNSAVERAKALAAERNGSGFGGHREASFDRDMGRGSGFDMGRGGYRGGSRGGFRGGNRGDFRGGYRGRGRW